MSLDSGTTSALVRAGLSRLGIDKLLVTVHDSSFPSRADEDIGRGTPYSEGAHDFIRFAAELGFNGLQLGPQGKTSRHDPSPYNGAQFARSHQSLDLFVLEHDERTARLIDREALDRSVRLRPDGARQRSAHGYTFDVVAEAMVRCHARFVAERPQFSALDAAFLRFNEREREWLEPDGLYEALAAFHGSDHFLSWSRGGDVSMHQQLFATGPSLRSVAYENLVIEHPREIERNAWTQCLLDLQHTQLRQRAKALGLALYADFQIGYASRDLWRWGTAFLPDYAFGAPPSRTNPDGQPWGYPVLDPLQLSVPAAEGRTLGPAGRLLQQRARRLLRDFDGLRIDHPHGLVCPWVYDARAADPLAAVQHGARLRASPADPRHPALAAFAIARPDDLSTRVPALPPYADAWVQRLDDAQVARYAEQFDLLIDEVHAQGRSERDVAAEVLSTCPYPLARVLARHGLGRFRVVQKADPSDEQDPYRSERAQPADWIMLGTHDTPTIWSVAPRWDDARVVAFAGYLATRLALPNERSSFAERLTRDRNALVHALFADLFLGPARHVSVFFADLFGMNETYNEPGVMSDSNWRLRVPPEFATLYSKRVAAGQALGIARATGTALLARAAGASGDDLDLAHALLAASPLPRL